MLWLFIDLRWKQLNLRHFFANLSAINMILSFIYSFLFCQLFCLFQLVHNIKEFCFEFKTYINVWSFEKKNSMQLLIEIAFDWSRHFKARHNLGFEFLVRLSNQNTTLIWNEIFIQTIVFMFQRSKHQINKSMKILREQKNLCTFFDFIPKTCFDRSSFLEVGKINYLSVITISLNF